MKRVPSRTNRLRFLAACSLLAGLIGMSALEAQEPTHELPAHEVIGSPEDVFRVPGAGYVVEGSKIEAFQLDDINRLLTRVPGVYYREEDGYGLLANLSLRGVDTSRSSKLTLMEDGIPTAPAPYSAPAAYYTPTTGRMSAVEILKGTSQVRFGPHTTGGVINYVSTQLPGRRAGYLEGSYGSDSDQRIHFWYGDQWNTEAGTVDALFEYYFRDNNGFRTIDPAGGFGGSDQTGFDRSDYMAKVRFSPGEKGNHQFEAKIGYSDLTADISYLGQNNKDFRENPYRRYAATRNDVFNNHHMRSYLRYRGKFSDRWETVVTGYYNNFHRNWYKLNDIRDLDTDGDGTRQGAQGEDPVSMGLSSALAGAQDGAGLEALKGNRAALFRLRANNRDYYLAGLDARVRGRFESGNINHNSEFGLRIHQDRIRRLQWHDRYDQDSDGNWSDPVQSALGSDGNRRQETQSTAIFYEHEFQKDALTIRPGVRIEELEMEYSEYTKDGSNQLLDTYGDDLTVWSAGVATSYAHNSRYNTFLNLYRGFSVPGPRASIANDIQEEISRTIEAGLRRQNEDTGWKSEIIAFYTEFEDLIVIDNIGSGTTGSNGDPITENVGAIDSYGLEGVISGDLHQASEWSVPFRVSATWTVAELDTSTSSSDAGSIFAGGQKGSRVPYIPEFKLNSFIGLQFKKLNTGFNISWQDDTFSTASETAEPVDINGDPDIRYGRIDEIFLIDWQISYAFTPDQEIFFKVNNLNDKEYLVSRHPHGPRAGAPRTVSGGFRLRF